MVFTDCHNPQLDLIIVSAMAGFLIRHIFGDIFKKFKNLSTSFHEEIREIIVPKNRVVKKKINDVDYFFVNGKISEVLD